VELLQGRGGGGFIDEQQELGLHCTAGEVQRSMAYAMPTKRWTLTHYQDLTLAHTQHSVVTAHAEKYVLVIIGSSKYDCHIWSIFPPPLRRHGL
jgi:hypothetical protein